MLVSEYDQWMAHLLSLQQHQQHQQHMHSHQAPPSSFPSPPRNPEAAASPTSISTSSTSTTSDFPPKQQHTRRNSLPRSMRGGSHSTRDILTPSFRKIRHKPPHPHPPSVDLSSHLLRDPFDELPPSDLYPPPLHPRHPSPSVPAAVGPPGGSSLLDPSEHLDLGGWQFLSSKSRRGHEGGSKIKGGTKERQKAGSSSNSSDIYEDSISSSPGPKGKCQTRGQASGRKGRSKGGWKDAAGSSNIRKAVPAQATERKMKIKREEEGNSGASAAGLCHDRASNASSSCLNLWLPSSSPPDHAAAAAAAAAVQDAVTLESCKAGGEGSKHGCGGISNSEGDGGSSSSSSSRSVRKHSSIDAEADDNQSSSSSSSCSLSDHGAEWGVDGEFFEGTCSGSGDDRVGCNGD